MPHFSPQPCDQANAQCCCNGWIEYDKSSCAVVWGTTAAIEALLKRNGAILSLGLHGAYAYDGVPGMHQLWIRCAADGPLYLAAEVEVRDSTEYPEDYEDCPTSCCPDDTDFLATITVRTGGNISPYVGTLVTNTWNVAFFSNVFCHPRSEVSFPLYGPSDNIIIAPGDYFQTNGTAQARIWRHHVYGAVLEILWFGVYSGVSFPSDRVGFYEGKNYICLRRWSGGLMRFVYSDFSRPLLGFLGPTTATVSTVWSGE